MSQPQVFNNVTYSIPVQGDLRWGPALTRYLAALGTYSISPAGGLYSLTADLNFGFNFGVIAKYFSSESNNIASAGQLRLATNDLIGWRNTGSSADLYLAVNASNQLTFNNAILNTLTLPVSVANGGTGLTSTTAYAVLVGGTTSTGPFQTPGIGSSGQVLTSQGPGTLPIWSAAGTGSGTVNTGTANQLAYYASSTNAVSGLTAITASRTLVSDTNGLPIASGVTSTTLAFLDATSSVQTQINTKAPTASPTFTGTVTIPNGTTALTAAAYGQVNVLQTVQGTFATDADNTTNTYADTGIAVTVVPKLSTSHILLDFDVPVKVTGTTLTVPSIDLIITDSANTTIVQYINVFGMNAPTTTQSYYSMIHIRAWDAPGSTASKTYKVRFRLNVNAVGTGGTCSTCYAGLGQTTAFFTAMEHNQ